MIAKIKLYLRRTLVLLFNMIFWWVCGGVLVAGFFMFTMIPLFFGVSLIDWQFGTDLYSPVFDFIDLFVNRPYTGLWYSMAFFGVLGGFIELYSPISSTRTTTLDKWSWWKG